MRGTILCSCLKVKSALMNIHGRCQASQFICKQRSLPKPLSFRLVSTTSRKNDTIYEPDYINVVPEIDEYDSLNFKFRGYDFVLLESFSKYVHNMFQSMELECTAYPVPAKTSDVRTFKPLSTNVKNEYKLAKYERVVQVQNLPNTILPLFLNVIQQNLPEGVEMSVKEPDFKEDEDRYVPDMILKELKNQIEEIEQAKEERKKK